MPSKLEQLQQQYRRQLMQEKEERMIKIHTESQQKALSKVSRYHGIPTFNAHQPSVPASHHSPVKKGSPGVDRSRPLPPISKERSFASSRTSPVSAPTDNNGISKVAIVNSRSKSVDLVDSRQIPQRGQQSERGAVKNGYSMPVETGQYQREALEDSRQIPQRGHQSERGAAKNGYSMPVETGQYQREALEDSRQNSPRELPSERGAAKNGYSMPVQTDQFQRETLEDSRQSTSRGLQSERGNVKNSYSKPSEIAQPHRDVSTETKSVQNVEYERKADPDTLAKLKQAELQRLRAKAREETPPRGNGGFSTDTVSRSSTTTTATPAQKKAPAKPPMTSVNPTPARTRPSFQSSTASSSRKAAAGPPSKPAAGRGGTQQVAPSVGRKPPGPGQEQCRVCGRNFNSDRIEKHMTICQKAAKKKVKVFDATKMRVKGTEAEQFVRKGVVPKAEPKAKNSDWRKKHNDFIEAIRQAKMVQQHLAKGGKVSDLPPPPPSDTSDYVPCPYCGRKFNQGVAERHIPKCKNILSNKKNPAPRRK